MNQPPRRHSVMPAAPLSGAHSSGHTTPARHSMYGGGTVAISRHTASSPKADEEDGGNVKVVIRIRPSNTPSDDPIPLRFQRVALHPIPSNPPTDVTIRLETTTSVGGLAASPEKGGAKVKNAVFRYDRILSEESSQGEAYEVGAKDAVNRFLKGINVTIFAYGQTSSGKSYTMGTTGIDADYDALNKSNVVDGSSEQTEEAERIGIIPRAVGDIFEKAEENRRTGGKDARWECRCSFLELYNEDLIDLLSTLPASQSPPITIREDTKGRIVWSGLREVKVATTQDVMALLKKGSTRRRTGETGMNKESSRSHAIFSLTLVQVRRSGVGTASAESTELAAAAMPGRILARPTSFSAIPTHSGMRSPTPTGTRSSSRNSILPPSSSGMRAAQAASASSGRSSPDDANFGSQWVELISKFHFVDLAGSERMKKTGAVAERMKEGIAINSGLTALGNVISALADPSKTKAGLHVPYRDSKLTRLLQDSLGGNAYTIMIACVSPLEYNLSETLNTLRYGQRARSIRNRAEVNQVEVGWDDIEHLQTTVIKLRKELVVLKTIVGSAGKTSPSGKDEHDINAVPGIATNEELGKQLSRAKMVLADLQDEHDILRQYVQEQHVKTARLTKSYEESKHDTVAQQGSMTFAQLVDPIVKEYEQSIESLESELYRLKAAWTYANDLANEQEKELLQREQRLQKQDEYVTELRGRIAKLTNHENAYEDHIRLLESQIKTYSERADADSEIVANLRKDLIQAREREQSNSHYITQLELIASKTDEQMETFRVEIERLEEELSTRDKKYQQLEARCRLLNTSDDVDRLLYELGERDKHVADVEGQLRRAIADCAGRAPERDRLKAISEAQAVAAVASLEQSVGNDLQDAGGGDTSMADSGIDGLKTDVLSNTTSPNLQQEHARTLAELEEISSLHNAALQEIVRLVGELEDARKEHSEQEDSIPDLSSAESFAGSTQDLKANEPGTPSPRGHRTRRGLSTRKLPLATQNLSVLPTKDFHGGRGHSNQAKSRPQSSAQELSLSASSHSYWGESGSLLSPKVAHRQSLPLLQLQRSIPSLETEIRQLQDVLKRRDEEIATLEKSLRIFPGTPSRPVDAVHEQQLQESENETKVSQSLEMTRQSSITTQSSVCEESNTTSGSPESPSEVVTPITPQLDLPDSINKIDGLSPTTASPSDTLRVSLVGEDISSATSEDFHHRRLNELMRSMARKESAHREEVELLKAQLSATQVVNGSMLEQNNVGDTDSLGLRSTLGPMVANSQVEVQETTPGTTGLTDLEHRQKDITHSLQQEESHLTRAVDICIKAEAAVAAADFIQTEERGLSQDHRVARQHEDQLSALRVSLREMLTSCHDGADITGDELLIQSLRQMLADANAQRLENELSSEKLQQITKLLQVTQDSMRQLETESAARDATIHALEQRIQDITAINAKRRDSDVEDMTTNQPTSRLALARSATPSNSSKHSPPIKPPPTIPPPPGPIPALPVTPAACSDAQRPSLVEKSTSDSRSSTSSTASDLRIGKVGGSSVAHGDAVTADGPFHAQLEEQEIMIRTLNKQLLHCETDLQASMDMASALEIHLNTSERNLRKARTQLQENNKERESALAEAARSRKQLEEAQKEVSSVRNSIIVEKRSLEDRLSEERRAKERAKAQLEQRLNEMTQQSHSSKFKCF